MTGIYIIVPLWYNVNYKGQKELFTMVFRLKIVFILLPSMGLFTAVVKYGIAVKEGAIRSHVHHADAIMAGSLWITFVALIFVALAGFCAYRFATSRD